MIKVGVVSRSFNGKTVEECAEIIARLGFTSTELCFTFSDLNTWAYNGRRDMSPLTDEAAAAAVRAFRSRGIETVSVGAFSNLMERDADALEENFKVFERYIQVAASNGIRFVSTENGFDPAHRGINTATYESDFVYFKQNMARLCDIASQYGVCIAFEPCVLDLTPSPKRTRDFITQLEKDNLHILLDPANLIANADEEDMFKYLAPYVAYFHGKDRRVNDTYGRIVGDGEIDWPRFLRLYHEKTEGVPFILEYVNESNCAEVRDRVLRFDEETCRGRQ